MRLFLFYLLLASAASFSHAAETEVRVAGSSTLVAPFSGAATILKGLEIELNIDPTSNSPTAISAVGASQCDLGLSTRPLTPAERSNFPDRAMAETVIGYQALAFTVSEDVWQSGVRGLSKEEALGIYEAKITDWKRLGGDARAIKFFNPEKGRGAWEFFVTWLYGEIRKAPMGTQFET